MNPFSRRARYEHRAAITLQFLKDLSASMQNRIDNGDLDFNDVIYRTRDAANTLIEIREPK